MLRIFNQKAAQPDAGAENRLHFPRFRRKCKPWQNNLVTEITRSR